MFLLPKPRADPLVEFAVVRANFLSKTQAEPSPEGQVWQPPVTRRRHASPPVAQRRRPLARSSPSRPIEIQRPKTDLTRVKTPGYRSTLGRFTKETLGFLVINPRSTLVQK